MDLTNFRAEIDSVDAQLVKLFCRRMELSSDIAAYKRANNLQIYDPAREEAKLSSVAEMAGDVFAPYAEDLYRLLFTLSKEYQHKCNRE